MGKNSFFWSFLMRLWIVTYSGIQLVKWNIHFIFQNTDWKCTQCPLGSIKEDKLLGKSNFAFFFSLVSMLSRSKLSFPFSSPLGAFKKINTDLSFFSPNECFQNKLWLSLPAVGTPVFTSRILPNPQFSWAPLHFKCQKRREKRGSHQVCGTRGIEKQRICTWIVTFFKEET